MSGRAARRAKARKQYLQTWVGRSVDVTIGAGRVVLAHEIDATGPYENIRFGPMFSCPIPDDWTRDSSPPRTFRVKSVTRDTMTLCCE